MAQSHAALRATLLCYVEDQRASPSQKLLSPHPDPLPWGEGESFAGCVSDRIVSNGRSAAIASGASEVLKGSATVPSPRGNAAVAGQGGSGLRREKAASAPQAG